MQVKLGLSHALNIIRFSSIDTSNVPCRSQTETLASYNWVFSDKSIEVIRLPFTLNSVNETKLLISISEILFPPSFSCSKLLLLETSTEVRLLLPRLKPSSWVKFYKSK